MPAHKSQKYKNKTEFKIKYNDKKIELIKNAPLDKLCGKCYGIIEWKLKYGKYKVPNTASKCFICQMKTVVKAYRTICDPCAKEHKKCSKCGEQKDLKEDRIMPNPSLKNEKLIKMENYMKTIKEASRRKILNGIADNKITWETDRFYWCESGEEVEVFLKNKYKVDDEGNSFGDSCGLNDIESSGNFSKE